jgi:hypothetical protein
MSYRRSKKPAQVYQPSDAVSVLAIAATAAILVLSLFAMERFAGIPVSVRGESASAPSQESVGTQQRVRSGASKKPSQTQSRAASRKARPAAASSRPAVTTRCSDATCANLLQAFMNGDPACMRDQQCKPLLMSILQNPETIEKYVQYMQFGSEDEQFKLYNAYTSVYHKQWCADATQICYLIFSHTDSPLGVPNCWYLPEKCALTITMLMEGKPFCMQYQPCIAAVKNIISMPECDKEDACLFLRDVYALFTEKGEGKKMQCVRTYDVTCAEKIDRIRQKHGWK